MSDLSTIGFKADMTGINRINKGLDDIGTHSTKAATKMGKASKSGSQAYTQLGYQINDFATQIASGQSAMVALTQQGSQLIQVFNPLASAAFAVAGAIAGALLPSLFDTRDVLEDITLKTDGLTSSQRELIKLRNAERMEELTDTLEKQEKKLESLNKQWDNSILGGLGREMPNQFKERVLEAAAAIDQTRTEIEELDSQLDFSESKVKDITESYTLKTAALDRDREKMAKNIAIQSLGNDATDDEIFTVSMVIEGYYEKVDAINAEIEAEQKAEAERKKAEAAALSQALAYDKWTESVEKAANPAIFLQQEIDDIYQAMADGDVSIATGAKRIEQLGDQIKSLSSDPMSDFIGQTSQALQGIREFEEQGTESYENLTAAIYAAATAQALMSGNYLSAAISGFSTLDELFGGTIDASAYIDAQESQGLNEWNEKADSINDAVEVTASATEKLVGINTDMLDALTGLQDSILSASGIVSRDTVIPTATANFESNALDYIGWFSASDLFGQNVFTEIFDFLTGDWLFQGIGSFLGGSSSVSDEGIRIIGDSFGDLLNDVTVLAFQEVKYKKWRWGSTKTKTTFSNISNSVGDQFQLVFNSLADSVAAGASALGLDTTDIENAINSFVVGTIDVSLKGLSTDEQAEAIEDVFSQIFNNLTESVIPWIGDFQDAGEDIATTLSRVATEVSVADWLVETFGVTFGDKMADPYMYAAAADNLSELAGSVEDLADQSSAFLTAFADDATLLEVYSNALTSSLEAVGLSLPTTTDGMYDLMSTLDGTTEAGQEQITTLLSITDNAEAYYSLLEDQNETLIDLSDSIADTIMDMYDLSDATTQVSLDAALAAAKLGDFSLAENLDLSDIQPDESDFSTLAQFQLAQADTANKLLEIAELSEDQTDVESEQLEVLREINEAVRDQFMNEQSNAAMLEELKAQRTDLEAVKYASESNAKTNATMAKDINRILNVGIPVYE